jgi:hypothetical protein
MALGKLKSDLFPLTQRQKPCTGHTEIRNRRWQHLLMVAQPPVRGRTRHPGGLRRYGYRQPGIQPFPER